MEKRLLIVDDNELIRHLLKHYLFFPECTTVTASNGTEALKLLNQEKYDIIISDYAMPGMNGVELARCIKQNHPSSTIIMVTGESNSDILSSNDIEFHFRKPLNLKKIKNVIKELLFNQ
ncbi:MAG: response regulator [Spirochaetales bacterium]|nr:response regulator [Spirochaetales bacterium]